MMRLASSGSDRWTSVPLMVPAMCVEENSSIWMEKGASGSPWLATTLPSLTPISTLQPVPQ